MRVFVLLFNSDTGEGGIHTITMGDRRKVLMFASEDDATRYALMLEAQDFPIPSVEMLDSEEIIEFCQEANYEWEIIEEGTLELPPPANVEQLTWEAKEDDSFDPPPAQESDFASDELDRIRRQLEGLL
jgi:hypothetical protein